MLEKDVQGLQLLAFLCIEVYLKMQQMQLITMDGKDSRLEKE
jgi:hypothetical protein